MKKILTREDVNKIWDILVQEAGASNRIYDRDDFVSHVMSGEWIEYRFIGNLGFGGKVWNNCGRVYVTCYSESETPERLDIIERTNKLLAQFNA